SPTVYRHRNLEATVHIAMVLDDRTYGIAASDVSGYTVNPTAMASTVKISAIRGGFHALTTSLPVTNTTQSRLMRKVDVQELDRGIRRQGAPRRFAVRGDELIIDTFPTSVEVGQFVGLETLMEPPDLTTGATLLDDAWDEIVVAFATEAGWRKLNNFTAMHAWAGEAARLTRDVVEPAQVEGENIENRATVGSGTNGSMPMG
ncbi:hypothetical protein LCGC14_2672830, partial [marine sediment metagenome]